MTRTPGRSGHDMDPAPLEVFVYSSEVQAPAMDVFRWHQRPEALLDLMPLRRLVRVEQRDGDIRDGGRVVFSIGVGPVRAIWEAVHFGFVDGVQFCDEQVKGPFRVWRHTHRVEPSGPRGSILVDRIEYALPGGRIVGRLARPLVRRALKAAFARRHAITRTSLQAGSPVQSVSPGPAS